MPHLCGKSHLIRNRRICEDRPVVRPREEIERLARSYWEARGCQGGSAEEDWYRAEREWDDKNRD
jgi:Protein of unknown function (DUF2934)